MSADVPALDRYESLSTGLYTKVIQPVVTGQGIERVRLERLRPLRVGLKVGGEVVQLAGLLQRPDLAGPHPGELDLDVVAVEQVREDEGDGRDRSYRAHRSLSFGVPRSIWFTAGSPRRRRSPP